MPISKTEISFCVGEKRISYSSDEVRNASVRWYQADQNSAHYRAVMEYTDKNPHLAFQYFVAFFKALEEGELAINQNGELPVIKTS